MERYRCLTKVGWEFERYVIDEDDDNSKKELWFHPGLLMEVLLCEDGDCEYESLAIKFATQFIADEGA